MSDEKVVADVRKVLAQTYGDRVEDITINAIKQDPETGEAILKFGVLPPDGDKSNLMDPTSSEFEDKLMNYVKQSPSLNNAVNSKSFVFILF